MPRFIILAVAVAVLLTVYAVVDCAMSEQSRIKVLPKPIWLVVALLLPVIGPVLWILFGKGLITIGVGASSDVEGDRSGSSRGRASAGRSTPANGAPDDDAEFLRGLRRESSDERIRRLEAELKALEEESGEAPGAAGVADAESASGYAPRHDGEGRPEAGPDAAPDSDPDASGGGPRTSGGPHA